MEHYKIKVKGIVHYQDKFLLVERWGDDRILDPYQWEFIDGELEFTEEPDGAILRIVREETGLDAVIERILYTWSFVEGELHTIGIAYECLVSTDEVILSEELPGYCWVTKDEIPKYVTNQMVLNDLARAEL